MATDIRASISALVAVLRSPSPDPLALVRQVVYVLPLVKNPLNLTLIVHELTSSPAILTTIENTGYLVDGLAAATERKAKTSDPTIPLAEWSTVLLDAASNSSPLVAVAVASGLLLGQTPRKEYAEKIILHFTRGLANASETLDLLVVCLSRAQWNMSEDAKQKLPLADLLDTTTAVIYSPHALESGLNGPVYAEFGAFSNLVALGIQHASIQDIHSFLNITDGFIRTAVAGYPTVTQKQNLKTLLFGVSLQLKGLAISILHNRQLPAPDLAQLILTLLQPLGFIVDEVSGSFEALSFVQNVCYDVLFESVHRSRDIPRGFVSLSPRWARGRSEVFVNRADLTIGELGQDWWNADATDEVALGKLLYFFDITEKLLPVLTPGFFEDVVLGAVNTFLVPTHKPETTKPLLESAHSLMLAYLDLSTNPATRHVSPEEAYKASTDYFMRVVDLYPSVLTFQQFTLAMDSVFAAAGHPTGESFDFAEGVLLHLYERIKSLIPGIPNPNAKPGEPPTVRAAFFKALVRALPVLTGPRSFEDWLAKLDATVPSPYSEAAELERKYFKDTLAELVSGLDLSLADVGIRYWFARGSKI